MPSPSPQAFAHLQCYESYFQRRILGIVCLPYEPSNNKIPALTPFQTSYVESKSSINSEADTRHTGGARADLVHMGLVHKALARTVVVRTPAVHMVAVRTNLVPRQVRTLVLDTHPETRQVALRVDRPSIPRVEVLLVVDIHVVALEVAGHRVLVAALVRIRRALPVAAASLHHSTGLEVVVCDHCIVPKAAKKHQAGIRLRDRRLVLHRYGRSHDPPRTSVSELGQGLEQMIGTDLEADHLRPPWHSDLVFALGSKGFQKPFRDRPRLVRWSKPTSRQPRHAHGRQQTSDPDESHDFCHS